MKNKQTRIKYKPRKYNLYKKKRSKGKEALAAIITIAAAIVLCVVGYGIGKPVVDYFQRKDNTSSDSSEPWSPTSEATSDSSSDIPEQTEPVPEQTAPPEPQKPEVKSVYILPESAALNSDSLNSAIAAAKNSGAQSVAVTLKDNTGHFLYKTEIGGVAEADIVSGALTAKQICDIINKSGMTPAARISTTKDHVSGVYAGENFRLSDGTGTWLDAAPANGGKRWLNPFSEKTAAYLGSVAEEISAAGFETIVLCDTMLPEFHPSDYSVYLYALPISNSAARCEALWSVISACKNSAEKNGAKVILEMSADGLNASDRLSTDAEPANDPQKLADTVLLLDFNGSGKSFADAKAFAGQTKAQFSGEFAVRIKGSGFSAGTLDEIKRAFLSEGIVVFTE